MKKIGYFLLFTFVVFFAYRGFTQVYFQQDEWHGFGRAIYSQKYGITSLIRLAGTHFTPLTTLFMAWFYRTFELNFRAYAWYSLTLHLVNTLLTYVLARTMGLHPSAGLAAALVFVVHAPSSQAVTWYAASLAFLPSTLFALLSLILFETFLKTRQQAILIVSSILLLVAAGFRENALFLSAYIVLRSFLVDRTVVRLVSGVFVSITLLYSAVRFVPLFIPIIPTSTATPGGVTLLGVLQQLLSFELLYLPKILLPEILLRPTLSKLLYPAIDIGRVEWPVHVVYGALGILFWLTLVKIFKASQKTKLEKHVFLQLTAYLPLSLLPFILLPLPFIIEPRHLYLTSVGYALLLGYIWHTYASKKSATLWAALCVVCFLYVAAHAYAIQKGLSDLVQVSYMRRQIANKFASVGGDLPKKALLYTTGDPLPLQTNPGHMFMVINRTRQPYHKLLYAREFTQGTKQKYIQIEDIGFGYFTDIEQLTQTYCSQHIEPSGVFAFSWNYPSRRFTNITRQTRSLLPDCAAFPMSYP